MKQFLCALITFLPFSVVAQPQATITNGAVTAKLYLPDAKDGYYRGSRFDWSGVMSDLSWAGHTFFSPSWNEQPYSPTLHDAVGGPVEEFTAIGYEQASVGGAFVKIGVGMLRKPDEKPYAFGKLYPIINGGNWNTKTRKDQVTFTHQLTDSSGYGYNYSKTVRLLSGKPILVLEHQIRNTGKQAIETEVYNHNFVVIDQQTTGPDFVVTFPFEPKTSSSLNELATIQGHELRYLRPLRRGEYVFASLQGFQSPSDYDIRVENRQTKAGVRITADKPISRLAYWSNPGNLSPEPYIRLSVPPGQEVRWTIQYEFYTLDR